MTLNRPPIGDRWRDVDRLFAAALDRPPAERATFLASACDADPELLDAVESLLRAEVASAGLFEAPGEAAAAAAIDALARHTVGRTTIGRYAVLGELGRGGMGTVYLGEQEGDGFRRPVAIKVLRRGLDTDDVMRRFVTERRILASLSHPNIARLFDGGATDDGRPFLVMEYVQGEPVTAYCDRHARSIRRRLELFLEVTDAVRAAHASLVVHRDLKPSNILVTAEGRVKLLDFGIAKLLDPDEVASHTQTGVHLMTPEHASPEQLRGEPVTTATDVYQLGVLLFQLLTGRTPHPTPARSPAAFRQLAGVEAPRPSAVVAADDRSASTAQARATTPDQLGRALRGDLDTIVLKALHLEPGRRYASAEQLAHDIRRFLDGRTISARPETLGYRTRTLLRRHPWLAPVAAAAMAFAGLYIGTLVRHAAQLVEERNAARLEADRAQEVQGFLVDLFRSADPYAPADPDRGRQITVVEALDVGVERLATSLQERPVVRAAILAAISEVYQNLGRSDRARPLREEALALQASAHGPTSREVRDSLGQMATIHVGLGEFKEAGELRERRLALVLADQGDPEEVASARIALSLHMIRNARQPAEAEPHLNAVLAMEPDGTVPVGELAEAYRALSDVHRDMDRLAEAEQAARRALALKRQALGDESLGAALAQVTLAQALGLLGHVEEADGHFENALRVLEETLGAEHGVSLATINNLAVLRLNSGNPAGAEALHRRLIELRRRVHGERHPMVGDSLQNLGTVLTALGRLDEARTMHERAAAIYRESLESDNYLRAFPVLSLSGIHLTQRRHPAAEAAAREALDVLERALPDGHYATAVAQCRVARALTGQGRLADAQPLFERSAATLVGTQSVPAYRQECLEAAADFFAARGRAEDAATIRAALQVPSG